MSANSREGTWGTGAIDRISEQLRRELPGLRGFSASSIKDMRAFYEYWCQYINRQPLAVDLQITENNTVIDIGSFALQNRPPLADEINREALLALKQWKVTT